MLGRIIGLLLGLGLGGLAYVVLYPGGLNGQIPVLELGPFEGLRLGLALAAGLVGGAMVIAAAVRSPTRRRAKAAGLPVIADFKFADEALDAKEAALPEEPRPFPELSPLQSLEASSVPEPAPFPAEAAAETSEPLEAEPAPSPTPLAAIAAAAPASSAEPDPEPAPAAAVAAPPLDDFDAARSDLRMHARAEAWGPAALALQRVSALASNDRQQMLAAQDAGDFARAQGRSDDAIEAYDLALSYARQAEAPELIADGLLNVGDMAYEEQRLDSAVESYEAAVALRRQIAGENGGPEARRALSIALERLADAREDRGHRTRALDLYRESEALAADLAQADAARYGADLASTRQRREELEARILA
ncbi:MAG: tetratricopeptide repeat protein [Phenylobacterium sp.]|uniref:tetratricopeptide repeat protein n=1 Tax=Phenylobacterium sp. TaxID=1871053 RepID=UPI002717B874|nr:tetratricopeptide repeat protein [Phenylobacterium sp.]MDO8901041.1 tetratricopeptide repeat protein [Phenylobacterium sp.]